MYFRFPYAASQEAAAAGGRALLFSLRGASSSSQLRTYTSFGKESEFPTGMANPDGGDEVIKTGKNRDECDEICGKQFTSDAVAMRQAANATGQGKQMEKRSKDIDITANKVDADKRNTADSIANSLSHLKNVRQFASSNMKMPGEKECKQHCAKTFPTWSDWVCFSGDTTVIRRKNKLQVLESVPISEICVGRDEVLVIEPVSGAIQMEKVLTWLHREPDAETCFMEIATEKSISSERSLRLRLTPRHLLFSATRNKFVQACQLREGELVREASFGSTNSGGLTESSQFDDCRSNTSSVSRITFVKEKGIYAPLTTSGCIVAGNICCSCYAVPREDGFYGALLDLIGEQRLLNGIMLPLRIWRKRVFRLKEGASSKKGMLPPPSRDYWA